MTWVYVVLAIFVGSNVETRAQCLLEKIPAQPQLSTTFMNGYWYEHLFANNSLQNESCAHFEIKCNAAQACIIYNYRWIGYWKDQIWNGTLTQNTEGVELVIHKEDGGNSTYDVNLKLNSNAVLIWSCNKQDELVFASTLYRMEANDDMMNVWEQASIDMSFPDIIEETPAGLWVKINPRECLNGNIKQAPNWAYILLALGTIVLVKTA